jgi:large subunit ribosomal protein L21
MYAIIKIGGKQFKVSPEQRIYTSRLQAEVGSELTIQDVLMVDDNGTVRIGTPMLSGVTVTAKVLNHLKDDKVLIFHKKRRKGYKKLNGFRAYLSSIIIASMVKP